MTYLVILLIAVSLSMDAFSLALSIGTLGLEKKTCLLLSFIVGMFHFFMPLFGTMCGTLFVKHINVDANLLSSAIFFYIAILMFKDFKNNEEEHININFLGMILFAMGVSLDSFGVGFAIGPEFHDKIIAFLTFSVASFSFTFLGLNLGKVLNKLVGQYSVLVGAIIMTLIAVANIVKFIFLG